MVTADEYDAFIEIHLSPLPFRCRLVNAIRYLLGYRSKWGDFQEIILSPETALELGDRLIEWSQNDKYIFQPNDVF